MLRGDLDQRSLERALSAQPFIEHDAQGILIAGWTRLAVDLLRCHVSKRADHLFGRLRARALSQQDQAKIAQQNLFTAPD